MHLCPGKGLNSALYDAWAACGEGKWERSQFLLNIRDRHQSKKRGIRKWLFAHEMDSQFTPAIAEAMRDRKKLDPELWETETRIHPECPNKEARVT